MKPGILVAITCIIGLLIVLGFNQFSPKNKTTFILPTQWSAPGSLPDHIILNLTDNPAGSQNVTWRTDTSVKKGFAEIALADAAPRFWRNGKQLTATSTLMDARAIEGAESISNYHSVQFNDLLPDTTYAYRVGDGQIWSEWLQFRTASKEPKPFSFLYVGDAQNNILELWSRVLRSGYKKAPDASFIIHAGDLVEHAHSERQWHEWFTAGGWLHGMLPSVPAPGNHEYAGFTKEDKNNRKLAVQWRHQFTLPENGPKGQAETAYYFDYQGARFIVLNSNEMLQEQALWLDSLLQHNSQKWIIVTFHHPIYSGTRDRDYKELRTLMKPLFDKYKVDLVLTGHDHTYTRGVSGRAASNVADGLNKRENGTVYVVSVSGGKMYGLKEKLWKEYDATYQRSAENTQLFQVININGNLLEYKSYTPTGEIYDAFDLQKDETGGGNKLKEYNLNNIKERNHKNTIPYKEPEKNRRA